MQVSTGSVRRLGWWALMLTCVVYSGFALAMAGIEVASWIDPEIDSKLRSLPKIFVVHALSGALALLVGPLQFHPALRGGSLRIHRLTGRAYVSGVWISSATAACIIPAFDVPILAKMAFGSLAVLWFATTTLGLQSALQRRITQHREWMLRSFALSLFFVTGGLWMELARSLSYAQDLSYPIAVFLGWALNLGIAEVWLRSERTSRSGVLPLEHGTRIELREEVGTSNL